MNVRRNSLRTTGESQTHPFFVDFISTNLAWESQAIKLSCSIVLQVPFVASETIEHPTAIELQGGQQCENNQSHAS